MDPIEVDLWPGKFMPTIRCGTGFQPRRWHSVDGQIFNWAGLASFVANLPENNRHAEVDVFAPRLNDLWPLQEVREAEFRRISLEHHSEVALDVADAAMVLGDALIQRLITRLTSRPCVAETLLDILYPPGWRTWRLTERPDIELGIRMLPLLGLVSGEWLDWALRQAFGDSAVLSVIEKAAVSGPELCAKVDRGSPHSTLTAFPPLVGSWRLAEPVLRVTLLERHLSDGETSLGYEDGLADSPKSRRCARNIVAEFAPPHTHIEIEVVR